MRCTLKKGGFKRITVKEPRGSVVVVIKFFFTLLFFPSLSGSDVWAKTFFLFSLLYLQEGGCVPKGEIISHVC